MAWFVRNKKKTTTTPEKENLWIVCSACKAYVFKENWEAALHVCPKCNHHERMTFRERLAMLVDPGSFTEFDRDIKASDPLHFVDGKGKYADKAEEARESTGASESVVTGKGKINRIPVVIAVMDFRFMGGSLGSGTGDKIWLAADYAFRHRRPFIVVSSSGGARMQEGIVSLMQMAKTCSAISRLNEAGIPYISVITNPTFGGVSASYAMVGDINIAEPKALIGFAGRRVIEQTIKQQLPDDFQTAEYLLDHGFLDRIVQRSELKDFLSNVLKYWHRR